VNGWVAVAISALFGCGRLDFDAITDSAVSDAPAVTCWASWLAGTVVLSAPQLIAELASTQPRTNPFLTTDGLHLYFDDFGAGNGDIWRADRDSVGVPWHAPALVAELSSSAKEGRVTLDTTGTIAIWVSARGGPENLWYATRATTADPFGTATQTDVAALDGGPGNVLDPEIIGPGLRLYASPLSGSSQTIEVTSRASTALAFGAPVSLPSLSISSGVGDTTLSPDERVIVFTSGATGPENDLYYATRADATGAFGAAQPLAALNMSNVNDGDSAFSSDGCSLIFRSDRSGTSQLYLVTAQ
jgi:hypothetical protein